MGVRRRYVDVSWGQVHLREAGAQVGRDGALLVSARPLLVMIHQSPLSSRTYAPVLDRLGEVVHVVAPDTAGYGGSDAPPVPWTIPDYAAGLWEVVDALGADEVVLLGQHTGAVVAVEATRQQPGRVRGVVLHGVPVYTDEERADRAVNYAPPYVPTDDGAHLRFIWDRLHGLYPHLDPLTASGYVEDYLATGPDYGTAYRAVFAYDIATHLDAVADHPVLLLCGEHDLVHHHHLRAAARLSAAREVTLPGCTDFAPAEDPERFAAEVVAFLADLGPRA